jgi:hypothetical protein
MKARKRKWKFDEQPGRENCGSNHVGGEATDHAPK